MLLVVIGLKPVGPPKPKALNPQSLNLPILGSRPNPAISRAIFRICLELHWLGRPMRGGDYETKAVGPTKESVCGVDGLPKKLLNLWSLNLSALVCAMAL